MGYRRAAVVMAGGSGTRFWPASTASRPKQFLHLASAEESLLSQAVSRIRPLVGDDIYVSASRELMDATLAELPGIEKSHVLCEPHRRNTLGALVWSTANLLVANKETTSVAVLAADHMIAPTDAFQRTVERALGIAEETGSLVTIGVKPTRPATEYGYVETGETVRFTEKPDAVTADGFVKGGRHLWNSGMFFWTLGAFCSELELHQPRAYAVLRGIEATLRERQLEDAAELFATLQNVSIDYALMERSDKVAVVEAEFEWDDLGSWDALSRARPTDAGGNAAVGSVRIVDSTDCVVFNEADGVRVSVLGMEGAVVVVSGGEVLVCKKERAQEVRDLAD